eukprot:CAMPEP_0118854202 /NCGR_PEP_ID=MMETSP1163-20130328/2508_1 /TAXON_ID=124430 /ORGANISM="Phaeomonas parva, Strain CCMP2877" /LENGTH=309 /DNA_ID=CAMNT_0006786889 /DNA_START=57 /DNA_END=986 /DNA_ORIENTATION=-
MKAAVLAAVLGSAAAFAPAPARRGQVAMAAEGGNPMQKVAAAALAAGLGLSGLTAPANAITKDEINSLTYLQVKGTGLANRCAEAAGEGAGEIGINGKKQLVDMCLEPKQFLVEEEVAKKNGDVVKDFVKTKLMTRQTYTLDGVSGTISNEGGKIKFTEEDGIDYAATTVQLPGGERVPFLFTVKELVASGSGSSLKVGTQFGGDFKVPSYRTGLFLDPKGRGMTTGYDMAVALPGLQNGQEGDAELFNENNKKFDVIPGKIEFEVTKVNVEDGEVSGVFVSKQPSDTDLGSKVPKTVLLKGIWYGRIE